ncbi:hypothetical protein SERLA73DRAFT_161718 [Serpula lacrymans var. lacrymans S7.3]|uniref:Uncharacterized protein n=1 Tax=Serpula lacrymans var. lacrymans (strain S7.3) TaxID=936435 RepID=F8Q4Z9_SERL3|nr:hypothetical protein SERLA73DRAFT_161718 [Serpula lacrymans var. lacrymans S7.3]
MSKSPDKEVAESFPEMPDTADAFGGFESAIVSESSSPGGVWTNNASSSDDPAWGSAWAVHTEAETDNSDPPDEWEIARKEKEKQNRAVPPETLASLLEQCKVFTDQMCPELQEPNDASGDSQKKFPNGMDDLKHILQKITSTALLNQLVPEDITLPPPVDFEKTSTAKSTNDALRLTRHLPHLRKSPLAQYLASKGSTAWETSVKSRSDLTQDDTPLGWRIMDKDTEVAPSATTGDKQARKNNAGLLSFWGRRASTLPSVDTKAERTQSPIPPSVKSPSIKAPVTSRSSVDSGRSTGTVPVDRTASPALKSPTSIASYASSASTPPPQPSDALPVVSTEPAPSAVSRFFSRFSRTRNTASQRNSIALSSDDLAFLSDIVPSANDPDEDISHAELKALSTMIDSSPLPPKLPPPLPPPPKPSSSSRPVSTVGSLGTAAVVDDIHELRFGSNHTRRATSPASAATSPTLLPPTLSPVNTSFFRSQTPLQTKPLPGIRTSSHAANFSRLPSPPHPRSRSQSPMLLPPPPSTQLRIATPPLIPPPPAAPSRTQTPKPVIMAPLIVSAPSDSSMDDDEFSAFYSGGKRNRRPIVDSESLNALLTPSSFHSAESRPLDSANSSSSFDDFDDFVSSPLRTPSPPPPPAKTSPHHFNNDGNPPSRSSSVKRSDHQRTQTLVENAASRPGKWPALQSGQPSPQPQALPPPHSNPFEIDLLGDFAAKPPQPSQPVTSPGSSMRALTSPPTLMRSLSPVNRLSPPPSSNPSTMQPLLSFPNTSSSISKPAPSKPFAQLTKPASSTGGGALSAQDLSFFEGL